MLNLVVLKLENFIKKTSAVKEQQKIMYRGAKPPDNEIIF